MPAVLHHERVTPPGANPRRWVVFLHGFLGTGRNWQGVARRVVNDHPDWGAILPDLREHGRSTGLPPPHTLDACAADVRTMVHALGLDVRVIVGHSFGGKVALSCVRDGGVWSGVVVVDSTPSPVPDEGVGRRMLDLLDDLPPEFESRARAVDLLAQRGVSMGVAQWMAMNLTDALPLRWRFDRRVMRALYDDFRTADLWGVLEDAGGPPAHFLCGEASSQVNEEDRRRIAQLPPRVTLDTARGGHWLHVDNPGAVVDAISRVLASA